MGRFGSDVVPGGLGSVNRVALMAEPQESWQEQLGLLWGLEQG